MDAYRGFASVYDRLMDDFDYPAWAEYYIRLIESCGMKPETICECACGTGSIGVELAERGLKVLGTDISPEMLELAREKALQRGVPMRFAQMDMSALELPRPVDAIICACDGVNYLTIDKKALSFFRRAYGFLKPGGVLAFDISSAYKLRKIIGSSFFGEERDDVAYLWQNSLRGDIVTMDLTFFVREKGEMYRRIEETHTQRAYERETIEKLLREAGFERISCFGDRTFTEPEDTEKRLHFAAVRE